MTPESIIKRIGEIYELYSPYLPYLLVAFLIAVVVTPWAARLAARIGAMDLPASLRGRGERNLETRINDEVHPKLGGLGVGLGILITLLLAGQLVNLPPGIVIGAIVIMVYGFLDDKYDLPWKWQLLGQFVAATAAVYSGVSIGNTLTIAGQTLTLATSTTVITSAYTFIFPSHIITVLWIMAVINFVNWVGGVDGLNNAVSAIASGMILITAVSTGFTDLAILGMIAAMFGANVGTGLYVYPPAQIFNGAIGEHLNGFLLAVFAISTGAKSPVALLVLGIPILDAIWVMGNRIAQKSKTTKNPFQLLSAATSGDRTHLHHRLMDMGFSRKGVLATEVAITIMFSAAGLYLWGITQEWVPVILVGVSLLLLLIAVITTVGKQQRAQRERLAKINPALVAPEIKVVYGQKDSSVREEKYVY